MGKGPFTFLIFKKSPWFSIAADLNNLITFYPFINLTRITYFLPLLGAAFLFPSLYLQIHNRHSSFSLPSQPISVVLVSTTAAISIVWRLLCSRISMFFSWWRADETLWSFMFKNLCTLFPQSYRRHVDWIWSLTRSRISLSLTLLPNLRDETLILYFLWKKNKKIHGSEMNP